jgi:hypothetical protein
MSSPDSEDFENDLLSAMERDLRPLLEESSECLELDHDQIVEMEGFLTDAWFAGTRSGHAQLRERAIQRKDDIAPVGVKEIEAGFKALMEESANALELTLPQTINMWGFLGRAWIAGTHTCEAEIMAKFLERNSDVGEEALQWLEERGDSKP